MLTVYDVAITICSAARSPSAASASYKTIKSASKKLATKK